MKIYKTKHPLYAYYVADGAKGRRKYFRSFADAKLFLQQGEANGETIADVKDIALRDLSDVSVAHKKRAMCVYNYMCSLFKKMPLAAINETHIGLLLSRYSDSN